MTADRATLEGLLARVEKATGPDRRLDHEIYAYICHEGQVAPENWATEWVPAYTASIDAALTLVEQARPGTLNGDLIINYDGSCSICISPHVEVDGEAATRSLAILAALLKALIAATP